LREVLFGASVDTVVPTTFMVGPTLATILHNVETVPTTRLLLSREQLQRKRNSLQVVGNYGKVLMGVGMLVVSALILTKTDKIFETFVTARLPDWLIDLSSKY